MKIKKYLLEVEKYGAPKKGNYYISDGGYLCIACKDHPCGELPIVKKANLIEEEWRPKEGEIFLFVMDTGNIDKDINDRYGYAKDRINVNNCFPDTPEGRAEAEKKAEAFKKLLAE